MSRKFARRLAGILCDIALIAIVLSIPGPLSVALAMLGFAVALSLVATAIFAVLTGDWPEVARLLPGRSRR